MDTERSYEKNDRSLVERWLGAAIWEPLARHVPASVHPNAITLLGALFSLASVLFLWLALRGSPLASLGVAGCTLGWFAADNVDGRHARRTGQTSALGEFLDHWLDLFTSLIVTYSAALLCGLDGTLLLAVAGTVTLGYYAAMWEQRHSGVFQIEEVGANEAAIILVALYTLLAFLPDAPWLVYRPGKVSVALAVATAGILGGSWTVFAAWRRCHGPLRELLVVALGAAALAGLGITGIWTTGFAAAAVLAMHGLMAGPLLLERLTGVASRLRGPVVACLSILTLAGLVLLPEAKARVVGSGWVITAVIVAGCGAMAWDLLRALRALTGESRDPSEASG